MTRPRPAALPALAVAGLLLAGPAFAAGDAAPHPAAPDPRIRTVDYDPAQVVRLVGAARTATQIVFAPGETILHVALGDTAAWEVAPEGNVLFVKPTAVHPPTNLIVTSRTAAGGTRHYTFELSARAGPARRTTPDTVFGLRFRYPGQEAALLQAALTAEARALEARVLQWKLARGAVEGPRNLAYELQGSAAIAPSEVSDNGRFTVLRFPGTQAIPAVYAVSPDGAEALVPFDVRGEFLVVHQVAAQLRLRRGREVLCLFNLGAAPAAPATGTATAAADVDRTLLGTPPP